MAGAGTTMANAPRIRHYGLTRIARDGSARIAAENHTRRGSMYLETELLLMLRVAGFERILVQGDHSPEPATPDHAELTFTAIR